MNKRHFILLLILSAMLFISFAGYGSQKDDGNGCASCHGSINKLKSLGYPQFYVTQAIAEKETRHKNIKCISCHLGDENASDKDSAHKGMLKPLFLSESGELLDRKKFAPDPMLPRGADRSRELLPPNSEVRNLLWHDRNPETLNFDPEIAKKTCGQSGCHSRELEQFRGTTMGANFRQRTMKTWLVPYGPHNCGPSFADTPSVPYLKDSGFDFKNTEEITKNLNTHFSKDQAIAKQKFCNVCHAGCLDCHYAPDRERGVHSFTKRPSPETCSGNGRGTSICHPGAMQSRRGETYIGGDYSTPSGMSPDVHYKNNIYCIDCHSTGKKGMGDIQRKATCNNCHVQIEEALKKSIHKNLDCAACHINELRGYQVTVWGPGNVAEKPNPFKKYSLYYGIQKPPILIKDQKGKWMPVKVWPHSVGNIKESAGPSEKMMFRWPDGQTRDAYYTIGTFDNLPENNKHLLWLEIEQAAHPYGKSRTCESCHKNESQTSVSVWEFEDNQGAEPFKGTHWIIADKGSLRIEDLKSTTPINAMKGYKLEDFAPWLYLKDKWRVPGDFSIKIDRKKYNKSLDASTGIEKKLRVLEAESQGFDENKKKRLKGLRGIWLHNPEEIQEKITDELRTD